jgi:hypothetical protein
MVVFFKPIMMKVDGLERKIISQVEVSRWMLKRGKI